MKGKPLLQTIVNDILVTVGHGLVLLIALFSISLVVFWIMKTASELWPRRKKKQNDVKLTDYFDL